MSVPLTQALGAHERSNFDSGSSLLRAWGTNWTNFSQIITRQINCNFAHVLFGRNLGNSYDL